MSNKEETVELESRAGPALDVAYDVSGRRMATCTASASSSIVQVYETTQGPQKWTHVATWATDPRVTNLAWAHPEYGRVLAGATSSGNVLVWGQVSELQIQGPASAAGAGGGDEVGGTFVPLAELTCGTASCRALAFAPRQAGLLLATLVDDGHVVVHQAEEVLVPRTWSLHGRIKTGPPGECRGLCWRPFTLGTPPILCVGAGTEALLWQYVLALNSWQVIARIATSNGQPVAAAHWANPLGRPMDLLALAAGRDVLLYGISGDTSALKVEQLASLQHDAPVWKVEWDLFGNQVAAGTEDGRVHVYKPNLVGAWVQMASVQGHVPEEPTA